MDAARVNIRHILRGRKFFPHPTQPIAKRIFREAANGYMNGYVTLPFLSMLADEILVTNIRTKRGFLKDPLFFRLLLLTSATGAFEPDHDPHKTLRMKLVDYLQSQSLRTLTVA